MRTPLVAGNWKMNGSKERVRALLSAIKANASEYKGSVQLLICPPSVYIPSVADQLAGELVIGAQNVSEFDDGAYTGEVSCAMLRDFGVEYVLVGHSERRVLFKETDQNIAHKAVQALNNGLTPVVCIGETLEERELGQMQSVLERQVNTVAQAVNEAGIEQEQLANMVLAYEPVWAIGTGQTASPEQAQDAHEWIRDVLAKVLGDVAQKIRILYGGSVKPDSALAIFSKPDIDGGLIGGASLKSDDFLAIAKAAKDSL